VFVYVNSNEDYMFVDAMRHKYGKLNQVDLQACYWPNELHYVCQEMVLIQTYVPKEDCDATLLHPSTTSLPIKVCE
jgi:hypothetical protein